MANKRKAVAGALCVLLASVGAMGTAHAAQDKKQLRFSLQLRATVPVACYLSMSNTMFVPASAQSQVGMGTVSEFCNSGSGYQVTASYNGEDLNGAALVIDGRHVPLSLSGEAILVDSNMPGRATRSLAFVPSGNSQAASNIALSISSKI